jgi:hypothetical protein
VTLQGHRIELASATRKKDLTERATQEHWPENAGELSSPQLQDGGRRRRSNIGREDNPSSAKYHYDGRIKLLSNDFPNSGTQPLRTQEDHLRTKVILSNPVSHGVNVPSTENLSPSQPCNLTDPSSNQGGGAETRKDAVLSGGINHSSIMDGSVGNTELGAVDALFQFKARMVHPSRQNAMSATDISRVDKGRR